MLSMGGVPSFGQEGPPLLQVVGEGRVQAAPDTVEISLGFTSRANTAAAAFQQTSVALNQVLRALLNLGIPRDQIQSEQISLNPVQENGRVVGFEATATLRVTLRDVSAAGTVIDAAVAAGANNVQGIRFDLRDTAGVEARALAAAVQDAQRQAAVLARVVGVTLGPIFRVTAEPSQGPIPIFARAVAAEGIPVLPGTITITRTVRLEYIIR